MRAMIRGVVVFFLLVCNLILWGTPVLVVGLGKLVTRGEVRRRIVLVLSKLAEHWVAGNDWIFDRMLTTEWDVEGIDGLRYDGHYLIISNHISWVDIFALFRAFHGHAAFIRFFLKRQLIWMPIAGQACWALDFPFMRRYTPEYLEKDPEKRGKDLETTRYSCRRFRKVPAAILNFLEGTRFSREKQADQDSPYKHLLRPRVGGIGFVLAAMGEQLDAMFDVTLAYPDHDVTMWAFVTNRVPRVVIRVRRVEIPPDVIDAAVTQTGTPQRAHLKEWIDDLWREKDALLDSLV